MKTKNLLALLSTLALLACEGHDTASQLNIVRGTPVKNDPQGPAYRNVVGLADSTGFVFCTGSIVAEDLIVSAAHCVRGQSSVQILFGEPKAPIDTIKVTEIKTYKPYMDAAFPNFDVAYLKLARPIPSSFQPMEILRDAGRLNKATEFRLAGYGIEETDCQREDCHDELLQAKTWVRDYHDNPRLMSLVVFKGAAELGYGASCNGDSGGPAYAKIDNQWYLVGATNGATAYLNPDSFLVKSKSCEQGSDIYTFIGNYVPWIEKTSGKKLTRQGTNALPQEPSFVTKGETRPADAVTPSTWAEWLQFPYHNEEAWNTVNRLLSTVMIRDWTSGVTTDLVKLYEDGAYSEERARLVPVLSLAISSLDRQRFPEQKADLRPLASWKHLRSLTLTDEASEGISVLEEMPDLKSLTLTAFESSRNKGVDLSRLKNFPNLTTLTLQGYATEELRTIPWASLSHLETLTLSTYETSSTQAVDLSVLPALKNLTISAWPSAAKLQLPLNAELTTLTLSLIHQTDLNWLDVSRIKSVQSLAIARNVLTAPLNINRFQGKGVRFLVATDNGLRVDTFTTGFELLENAKLTGNALTGTDFLKNFPALKKVDLRNNPLQIAECPTGVECRFDRIVNPKTLAEYCKNTVGPDSNDYPYGYTIGQLMSSQSLPSTLYKDGDCDSLLSKLATVRNLKLEGDFVSYLLRSQALDARLIALIGQLQSLDLKTLSVYNAEALGTLKDTTSLLFDVVDLNQTDFIRQLPKLTKLEYRNAPVKKLADLSNATLKTLWASNATSLIANAGQIAAIGEDADFPALEDLNLYRQPLADLKGIGNLKSLKSLDISETQVTDISPLSGLIGTNVFLPRTFDAENCPVLMGTCYGKNVTHGGVFGAPAANANNYFRSGTTLPGFGKAIRT